MTDDRAQVVVVGAGLAGLETAWALHRRGMRDVLVLDAAPATGTGSAPARWQTSRPPHYVQTAFGPAAVGGRSLYWHGVVLRMEPWALAEPWWPRPIVDGLGGLYAEVEADLQRWAGSAAGGDADSALAGWLVAVGLDGARPVPRAVRDGVAYSPLVHWTDDATAPRIVAGWTAVELLAGSTAVRLRATNGRSERVVHGDAVVLAAGTLETTRLLLQAGDAGGTAVTGLNDHLVQGFLALVRPTAVGLPAAAEGFALVPGQAAARSNLFVRVRRWPGHVDRVLLDVWEMGEQLPEGQTSLTVAGGRALRVDPGLSAADRDVLNGQQHRLSQVWTLAGLPGTAAFPDLLAAPVAFDAARERVGDGPQVYAWPLGTVQHEGGALPLGGEMLDADGRVRAAPAVSVTGPVAFPRPGAANPSLTTLALARRTAALLSR